LFLEDGQYFTNKALADHLDGTQWGVMNETGSYPGQPWFWLWLYTLWYQVPGFDNSANVDLIAVYLTGVATVLLLAVPFIPGLRDIPRLIPLHRPSGAIGIAERPPVERATRRLPNEEPKSSSTAGPVSSSFQLSGCIASAPQGGPRNNHPKRPFGTASSDRLRSPHRGRA
jgi:hypothetical protein